MHFGYPEKRDDHCTKTKTLFAKESLSMEFINHTQQNSMRDFLMNHLNEITTHSQNLPENLQKEVLDFICFLEARYSFKSTAQNDSELTDLEIEQACGILQAPYSVTLEQMDEAIKKRGGRL